MEIVSCEKSALMIYAHQLSCNVFSIASEVREPRPNFYVTMTAMIAEKTHRAELLDGRIAADAIKRAVADEVAALKAERRRNAAAGGGDCWRRSRLCGLCSQQDSRVRGSRHCVGAFADAGRHHHERAAAGREETESRRRCRRHPGPVAAAKTDREIEIIEAIDPAKDIDAFHPVNVGLLAMGPAALCPCTPAGIIELLDRNNIQIEGANACVIGRSQIVGKPVAASVAAAARDRNDLSFKDARPAGGYPPGGHSRGRDWAARIRHGRIHQTGRGRDRCRRQQDK
jgi:hypothetical protein